MNRTIHPSWQELPAFASRQRRARKRRHIRGIARNIGIGFFALALGGLVGPLTPMIRMETKYRLAHLQRSNDVTNNAKPVLFTPLTAPDGKAIEPVDTNFGLVIPKIGINTTIIPAVNPASPNEYLEALSKGVAHSSTSYFPNENGTVYLFSHSTSYDWFVSDLNAVFYLVKNLEVDDLVVLTYKNEQYTYKITDKRVVAPEAVSYLVPHAGRRNLILQTCWPPGSTEERLLIFADLIPQPII